MKILPLKMTALSPIQYFYSAAAGGMRSSNFIGDIALKYAFLRQMGLFQLPEPGKSKPTYEELLDYPFWLTVGIPAKMAFGVGDNAVYMKNMIRNTMQGADYNGSNVDPSFKTGQLMYKNFFFVQPLKPGNIFYSYLVYDEKYFDSSNLPELIRVGNNKTGILKVEKCDKIFMGVINVYTIQNILGTKLKINKNEYVSHLILQYFLKGYYSMKEILDVYE
ncbi:type I-D CRISPR-associated protein Cas5/Csc1 [Ferroplasma acidiphilum]|uniref:Type I-D CRISPR-associated protein Cas5/Csc1 n=1 Tax=Ferroplasma acidiphilum TaxID=74969 RepID=A0A7K4FM31_9ARCH|nr:type I-D CRISPR-associated protein Cas5/Csc1 [Ferroplasma acidiphilum]NOL60073.1 type I-D CRISPR-associated protein Cas5/Csc1 [Ferroplasma acidiphilum]